MAKKRNNVKPDTALKAYWARNEEFADLFNALLYASEPVINADKLAEIDTESSVVLQINDKAEGMAAARDLFKVVMRTDNAAYALLGIENQQGIHYAMPLRDMEYCTYSYHKQYEKTKEKYPNKKGLVGNEFVSHMKKSDKFVPVITAVIYYGEEPWDGAKSLFEMLALPDELKPFANDYKLNLIEARNTELAFHNKNNHDLFHLFKLLYSTEIIDKEKAAIAYADAHNVDQSVILALGSANGLEIEVSDEKGGAAMCTLFKEIAEKSEARGEAQGEAKGIIETSRELGVPENQILDRLQQKLCISRQQAEKYLDIQTW